MNRQPAEWETYEQVAAHLLNEVAQQLGLTRIEGKQPVPGKSGANWVIDAKGVRDTSDQFVIVECRRHTTSKICQEAVSGLAWRIQDCGAAGGILVSPLGFQDGAAKVAAASRIVPVELAAYSTPHEFVLCFLDQVRIGGLDVAALAEVGEVTVHATNDVPDKPDGAA